MAQINHNISNPNDNLGDQLRTSFGNQNAMNTELYTTKLDKVTGKGLTENEFTNAEKAKLAAIAAGAEVNVQADWEQEDSTADDYIKNKPADFVVPAPTLQEVAEVGSTFTPSAGQDGMSITTFTDTDNDVLAKIPLTIQTDYVAGLKVTSNQNAIEVYAGNNGILIENAEIGVNVFGNSIGLISKALYGIAGIFRIASTSTANIVEFQKDDSVQASITHDGKVNANAFTKTGGQPTEYLMADGSVKTFSNTALLLDKTITTHNAAITGIQTIKTWVIPANTIPADCILKLTIKTSRLLGSGNPFMGISINGSTGWLNGVNSTTARRNIIINNTSFDYHHTSGSYVDDIISPIDYANFPINRGIANTLTLSMNCDVIGSIFKFYYIMIEIVKA